MIELYVIHKGNFTEFFEWCQTFGHECNADFIDDHISPVMHPTLSMPAKILSQVYQDRSLIKPEDQVT